MMSTDSGIDRSRAVQGICLMLTGAAICLRELFPDVDFDASSVLDLMTAKVVEGSAGEQQEAQEPAEDSVPVHASDNSAEASDDAAEETQQESPAEGDAPSEASAPAADAAPQTTLTQDDITKVIVRKLKQNRSNNAKIGQILKAHGVTKVSELPAEKYESFLTELSQL